MIKHIIFKVIGKCNLDCQYCYYMHDLDPKWSTRFPTERLNGLFKNISDSTKDIRISWHGGEPTIVGIDFFQRAVDAARLAGVSVRHSIQTNGTLINEDWCNFFGNNEFHVGVSIDGPESLHEKLRPKKLKKGISSYQGAITALELLSSYKVRHGTLTVVNADISGRDVYEHLRQLGVSSMDFLLPITDQKPDDKVLNALADYLLQVFDAWIEESNHLVKIRYFENIIRSLIGGKIRQCILCNNCTPFITLEPNGDIGMCENIRTVSQEFYETGINIFSSSLEEIGANINSKLERFGFNRLCNTCKDCDYVNACQGGCPVARHDGSMSFSKPSIYCKLYKTLIYRIHNYIHAQLPAYLKQK